MHTQTPLGAEAFALRRQAALVALDRYLETWNSRDPRIWATSLHFPHVRPGAGPFKLTRNTDEYAAGIDFEQTASTGWDQTEWVSREVLQVGVDKVHAAATWQRSMKDGQNAAAARGAVDVFVQAWNSHDVAALARAVHYPRVRTCRSAS